MRTKGVLPLVAAGLLAGCQAGVLSSSDARRDSIDAQALLDRVSGAEVRPDLPRGDAVARPDGSPDAKSPDQKAPPDTGKPDGGPWSVPFLARTPSGAVHLTNCSNVTITGKQFVSINGNAIIVEGCSNVTITANDFQGVVGAIYALNSTNVTVTWNRYKDIGDGTIGSGHSNFVQLNDTIGGTIAHNKGIGGNTEDIISIYKSGGADAANPLVIEHNTFEGTTWTSSSGSGLMLADAGGSHIVARFNTLLSPGQVGIGVASGTDIHVTNNTVYGVTRPGSNVGIYVWNQYSTACSGIEVTNNQVKWYRADGAENPSWDGGNCGAVAGWATNDWHATLNPATMHVTL